MLACDEACDDDAGKANHRANREIDTTGDDHECHADAVDPQHCNLPAGVQQICARPEVRIENTEDHAATEQGDGHSDFPSHAACPSPVIMAPMRSLEIWSCSRMPAMLRSRMTTTRSLSPMISSMSELTRRMAIPQSARPAIRV